MKEPASSLSAPGPGFGEEARGLTPACELASHTVQGSNIHRRTLMIVFAPDPVLKPSKERPGNPPALSYIHLFLM